MTADQVNGIDEIDRMLAVEVDDDAQLDECMRVFRAAFWHTLSIPGVPDPEADVVEAQREGVAAVLAHVGAAAPDQKDEPR